MDIWLQTISLYTKAHDVKQYISFISMKTTGVKHKARGPNAAHRVILCGPWRLERHMIAFTSRAFILKVSNEMYLCHNNREMFSNKQ